MRKVLIVFQWQRAQTWTWLLGGFSVVLNCCFIAWWSIDSRLIFTWMTINLVLSAGRIIILYWHQGGQWWIIWFRNLGCHWLSWWWHWGRWLHWGSSWWDWQACWITTGYSIVSCSTWYCRWIYWTWQYGLTWQVCGVLERRSIASWDTLCWLSWKDRCTRGWLGWKWWYWLGWWHTWSWISWHTRWIVWRTCGVIDWCWIRWCWLIGIVEQNRFFCRWVLLAVILFTCWFDTALSFYWFSKVVSYMLQKISVTEKKKKILMLFVSPSIVCYFKIKWDRNKFYCFISYSITMSMNHVTMKNFLM